MELAKVTSKGQITIPLMIRNKLQLKTTGDNVFFEEREERFILLTLLKSLWQMFRRKCKAKQKKQASRQKMMSLPTSKN